MIVAQISDMHVKRRGFVLHHMPHVAKPLERCLASIAALSDSPGFIVATGDLTENGLRQEYDRLREIVDRSAIPVFLIPGNHDRREALRRAFPNHHYMHAFGERALQFTIETPSLRVVAIDTSEPGMVGGFLDAGRLSWLNERLAERPETPTLLAMHHPPFRTGVTHFDRQAFLGRAALGEVVRAHGQIRRILCGHVHQVLTRGFCGTAAVSAPSTAPTLVLHPRAPGLAWEPGGYLLHRHSAVAGVTTQLVRVDCEPVAIGA